MRRPSFATTGLGRYGKRTRRAALLATVGRVVSWAELCTLVEPVCLTPSKGCRPSGLERGSVSNSGGDGSICRAPARSDQPQTAGPDRMLESSAVGLTGKISAHPKAASANGT
jgi:hypothetical protein